MTGPDDFRDDALARAIRDEAREEPPSRVDDAIRAAARRAVGTRPRAGPEVAEAREPWRWWMPLAAAATIGAIAVGVIQQLPRDALDAGVVTDAPPPATRTRDIPPATPSPARTAEGERAPAPGGAGVAGATGSSDGVATVGKTSVPTAISPPPAPPPEAQRTRRDAEQGGAARQAAAAPGTANAPMPPSAAGPPTQSAPAAAPAAAPAQVAKTFVPDAPRAGEGRLAAVAPEAPPPAPPPAAAASAAESRPAEALVAKKESVERAAGRGRPIEDAVRRDAPAALADARSGIGAGAGAAAQAPASIARSAASGGAAAGAAAPAAKSVDAHVAEIRRLLALGDDAGARRELGALRSAYADADARLPDDLRRWAAGVPR